MPAEAASASIGSQGNCNNQQPNGDSFTLWDGFPSNTTGYVTGYLFHKYGSTFTFMTEATDQFTAPSYDAEAFTSYPYIQGEWQETGSHTLSGQFSNSPSYGNIMYCP